MSTGRLKKEQRNATQKLLTAPETLFWLEKNARRTINSGNVEHIFFFFFFAIICTLKENKTSGNLEMATVVSQNYFRRGENSELCFCLEDENKTLLSFFWSHIHTHTNSRHEDTRSSFSMFLYKIASGDIPQTYFGLFSFEELSFTNLTLGADDDVSRRWDARSTKRVRTRGR